MGEFIEIVTAGMQAFLGVQAISALVIGIVLGIIIGVLPGLGPLLGVVLAIPFTFYMQPVAGMALMLGIYQGGSFGGAISAAVLGIPGTPMAASMTCCTWMAGRHRPRRPAICGCAVAKCSGTLSST